MFPTCARPLAFPLLQDACRTPALMVFAPPCPAPPRPRWPQEVKARTAQMDADLATKQAALQAQEQVGLGGWWLSACMACKESYRGEIGWAAAGPGVLESLPLLTAEWATAPHMAGWLQAAEMAQDKRDRIDARVEQLSEWWETHSM